MVFRWSCILLLACLSFNLNRIQSRVYPCNRTAACGCSQDDVELNARIVGGEIVPNYSWGWSVSIRYFDQPICGGTILSQNFIITAAHCVFGSESSPEEFSIAVGRNRLNSTEGRIYSPSKIYSHPGYIERTNENDIAILEFSSPIQFDDPHVSKICLPMVPEPKQTDYPYLGRPIVAIGWGTTSSRGNSSIDLRQVTVNTLMSNDSACVAIVRNTEIQFCAGVNGGGKDTCQGDSGGPIMYYDEKERLWILAGITSYGRGCGLPNFAGVYTRVSRYIPWIRSIVGTDGMVTIVQDDTDSSGSGNGAYVTLVSVRLLVTIFLVWMSKWMRSLSE